MTTVPGMQESCRHFRFAVVQVPSRHGPFVGMCAVLSPNMSKQPSGGMMVSKSMENLSFGGVAAVYPQAGCHRESTTTPAHGMLTRI